MIFYHYTSLDAMDSIRREGLNRGEAPLGDHCVVQAVNLTTDRNPEGHGLDHGGHVVTAAEAAVFASKGFLIPEGTVYTNKRAVRIKLILPLADRKLKAWRPWSRQNCEVGYAARLERVAGCGGRKARTWWLYFGTVPTSSFQGIDML